MRFIRAISAWYARRYGVELDPDAEAIVTIGSKEGLAHLMLACLERGYAIVRRDDASAAVIRDAGTLAPGDGVRIVLARGRARAQIDSTET